MSIRHSTSFDTTIRREANVPPRRASISAKPPLAASGPRWTGRRVLLLILVTVLALSVSDRIIGAWLHVSPNPGDTFHERVIRLKKYLPGVDEVRRPSRAYLADSDGLPPVAVRLRTDAHGFIMPTEVYPDPDLRLFFLGGSTTECLYVPEANRFPFAAARFLERSSGLRINSYNSGVSADNSLHSINILLNDILPLRPNVIVFMQNINDLVTLLYTGTYWNTNVNRSPIMDIDLQLHKPPSLRSLVLDGAQVLAPHVYAALRRTTAVAPEGVDEWRSIRGTKVVVDESRIRQEFRANLRMFVGICRSRGITPVLMTEHSRYTMPPEPYVVQAVREMENDFGVSYSQFYHLHAGMNEDIRLVAAESGAMLIDLDAGIPKSREVMYDTVHLNEKGSVFAARLVADSLLKLPEVQSGMKRARNSAATR